jgi:hypothetical protein
VKAVSISDMSAPRSASRIGCPASDGDERRAERLRDPFDRAPEEAGVEEIGGLDERGLRVRQPAQHGLGHYGLRVGAVRHAEELRPTRPFAAGPRRGERR